MIYFFISFYCLKRKRNLLHGYEAGADENVVVV